MSKLVTEPNYQKPLSWLAATFGLWLMVTTAWLYAAGDVGSTPRLEAPAAELPEISATGVIATEGHTGLTTLNITVTLSAPAAVPVTVEYATVDVTATAGLDYVSASGTLTFGIGETTKPISVSVKGDLLDESYETFNVEFSLPVNATLATAAAAGGIADDDAAVTTDDEVLLYQEDFTSNGGGFYNYPHDDGSVECIAGEPLETAGGWTRAGCRAWLPWTDGYVESTSPYWIDPNHHADDGALYPGLGFLNVVGFVWRGDRPFSLTEARVTTRMQIDAGFDLKGGHLAFWFQAPCMPAPGEPCTFTYADYILDAPIETRLVPGQWSEVTLFSQPGDWKCLGAQLETENFYGCMPIAQALEHVENVGFVLIPVPPDPVGDNSADLHLKIDSIKISRPRMERVRWQTSGSAVTSGPTLSRTGSNAWDSAGLSTQAIVSGDGFVEFTAGSVSAQIAGLARHELSPSYQDIDFGIGLSQFGEVHIYELGGVLGYFGSYAAGDRFRVAIEGGVVRYSKNGVRFFTSSVTPEYPLRAQAALFSADAIVQDATLTGRLAANVTWTGSTEVVPTTNSLYKTGGAGWNAGAVSSAVIAAGDGFAEFEATETNTTRMLGLTHSQTTPPTPADLDFAVRLLSNATIEIVEGGTSRGSFGAYAAADRFRVSVASGVVRYLRNGVVLYASTMTPDYPLRVGAALHSFASTVTDVVVAGTAERVEWINTKGVATVAGELRKFSSAGSIAGAASRKAIVAGDGFVEFGTAETTTVSTVGLSVGDASVDPEEIDFGIQLLSEIEGTRISVIENGVSKGIFGTYVVGDRFRVAVEAGVVRYFHGAELIYTSQEPAAYPLLVDASLSGLTTTATDVVYSGELAETMWNAGTNVTAVNGNVTKSAASSAWNSGTTSKAVLTVGGGFMEFVAPAPAAYVIAGLTNGSTATTYEQITFGVLLTSEGTVTIYESGTFVGAYGSYSAGDRFRIGVVGSQVQYWRNTDVLHTSTVAATFPLRAGTVLFTPNATITGIRLVGAADSIVPDQQPSENVSWKSIVGASASGGSLTKSAGTGWNAGAVSTRLIPSGQGYVEFTATTVSTFIAGLSDRDRDQGYADVDFGLLLTDAGETLVYERGQQRSVVGTYAAGDRFRISVDDGTCRYWRNGLLIYTSTSPVVYPLLLDTALYSPGVVVGSATIAGTLVTELVGWASATGVTTADTTVTKTAADGWNAGAVSSKALATGDGFMEFVATQTAANLIGGLTLNTVATSYENIDFGILLTDVGTLAIYESGQYRGPEGPYNVGDRLRVSIVGDVVQYWRNTDLLYTSTIPVSYPIRLGAVLFTSGASIEGVRLVGSQDSGTWDTQVGEAVSWKTIVGASISSGNLVKTLGVGWNAGAVSTRLISSEAGYVEFTAADYGVLAAGLSDRDLNQDYADVDFGVLLTVEGQILVYERGAYRGFVGTYEPGDQFRISLDGHVIRYWRNQQPLYTSTMPPPSPIFFDTALFSAGVAIQDATIAGTLITELVGWQSAAGVVTTETTVTKTASENWNAGAAGKKVLALGNGFMEFVAPSTPAYVIAGLTTLSAVTTYEDISFGVLLTAEGNVTIYEAGTFVGVFGDYTGGDRFRVAVVGTEVQYWRNDQLLYARLWDDGYPLRLGTALYSAGVSLSGFRLVLYNDDTEWDEQADQPVTWTAAVGVTVSGNSLQQNSGIVNWTAGAISNASIAGGAGYVEFTATETNTYRAAGLNALDADQSFEDLDFAVLLTADGTITIYEAGTYIGSAGAYAPGDRFRVSVADGVVRYWRNEVHFYTSTRPPSYPLKLDTSLFSNGSTIAGATIAPQ